MIPFSGYTKWTGDYNAAYTYYTKTTEAGYDVVDQSKGVDAKATYYTLTPAKFTKVDTSKTTFDKMRQYYTYDGTKYVANTDKKFETGTTYYVYEGAKYEEVKVTAFDSTKTYYTHHDDAYTVADITAFAAGTDYYVRGYNDITYDDKGNIVSRGDFGIKLAATLVVDDNIVIEATVKNLDIFGLPATLNAKISNVQIKLWAQDFKVFNNGATVIDYSTIAANVVR